MARVIRIKTDREREALVRLPQTDAPEMEPGKVSGGVSETVAGEGVEEVVEVTGSPQDLIDILDGIESAEVMTAVHEIVNDEGLVETFKEDFKGEFNKINDFSKSLEFLVDEAGGGGARGLLASYVLGIVIKALLEGEEEEEMPEEAVAKEVGSERRSSSEEEV